MAIYDLNFIGYLDDNSLDKLPEVSGIYCVFAGIKAFSGKLIPSRLIYIGQAGNLKERHQSHEYHDDWLELLNSGEELCYCYTKLAKKDLDVVENALIYENQPPFNTNCKQSFNYDFTAIICHGAYGTLKGVLCVKRAA